MHCAINKCILLDNNSVKTRLNLGMMNFNIIFRSTKLLQKYLQLHFHGVKVNKAQIERIYSM